MKTALAYVVVVVAGLVTATVGAAEHRAFPYWGLAACLLMVACAAVFSRGWLGFAGLGAFAAGWMTATGLWSLEGPGGSILIALDTLGVSWLVGSGVVIVAAAVVPNRVLEGRNVAS